MANSEERKPEDSDMNSGCCSDSPEPKPEKDFRKEADAELESIKRDADKANRDIEEVVEKGTDKE